MSHRLEKLRALLDELPPDLERQAFSHSSWVEDRAASYERLAFLGDSVLSLSVSTSLFPRFERHTAGRLTKIRAQAVSRRSCVEVARALDVPRRMLAAVPSAHSEQAQTTLGSDSVLAEALEAVIGACYLTFGFERTAEAVASAFTPQVELAIDSTFDFKSQLQERLAQRGELVTYTVTQEEGPPHDRRFETVAEVNGRPLGRGGGRSKKEAEQEAARQALESLKENRSKG